MGNRRGLRLGFPRNRPGLRLGLPRLGRLSKSELASERRKSRNLPIVVEEDEEEEQSSPSDDESIRASCFVERVGGGHADGKSTQDYRSREPTGDENVGEVDMNDDSVSSCHTRSTDDGRFAAQESSTSISSSTGTSLNKYNGSLLSPSTYASGSAAPPDFACGTRLSCSVATPDVLSTVQSDCSNLSERKRRARQLKKKMQVLLEVAHQKSLSGSFSAVSSGIETKSTEGDSILTSVKSLQNLENETSGLPRLLSIRKSHSDSACRFTSNDDDDDGERKCSDTSSFESEETITSELISIGEPRVGSLTRPLFLDSMGSVSFSSRLTQELFDDDETLNSMTLTMVSTALSSWSADTHDPKCCDQLLDVDTDKPIHITDYLIQWRDKFLLNGNA